MRLFARAFGATADRIGAEFGDPGAGIRAWLAGDRTGHCFRLLVCRAAEPAAPGPVDLDLTALGLAAGTMITIEEISADYAGGISRQIPLSGSGRFRLDQPVDSVWLLTLPLDATELKAVRPTQAALVRGGTDADTALGDHEGLAVQRAGAAAGGADEVTLLEFRPKVDRDRLSRATLEFPATAAASTTVLVVAATDLSWDAADVTWNSAPYLGGDDAVLTGDGDEVSPVGQLTIRPGTDGAPARLDVTDVLRRHDGDRLTFLVINQPRGADDTAEDGQRSVLQPAGGSAPRLRIWVGR
ncbi:DUF7594 domain-containing protein [Microlunatus speluncae]|uniref:CBM96 family carbohydrate-binding protein n=1 Tax=Microlunatus speluncae TaxID=2594267 RepID=UPI0012663E46|nr:hypothetical protein [Microlunatus speluncae]